MSKPEESKYFLPSLDFEIMRLTCSLSKFKKQCTATDLQHFETEVRDTRENFSLILMGKLQWFNFAEPPQAD